jgi:hypothetical protein
MNILCMTRKENIAERERERDSNNSNFSTFWQHNRRCSNDTKTYFPSGPYGLGILAKLLASTGKDLLSMFTVYKVNAYSVYTRIWPFPFSNFLFTQCFVVKVMGFHERISIHTHSILHLESKIN